MVAFLLTEFGITNTDSAAKVKGIMVQPNGTSDQAFIAYNTAIISLDLPVITAQPATQTFCSNTTTSATFSVAATSTTTATYQWKKKRRCYCRRYLCYLYGYRFNAGRYC